MREGPRQIAVGTVLGALLGVAVFFALAAQRIGLGDDLVLAVGWGVAGLMGTILLGRMVDAFLWAPALMVRPKTTSESPADTEAKSSGAASATRGTAVDLKLDDDTDSLAPAADAAQPDDLAAAA